MYQFSGRRSRDMLNFDFSKNSLGLVSTSYLFLIFQEKYFSCYVLLTDQISDFLKFSDSLYFWVIWQYMYCNYLLSSLWRHKTWSSLESHFLHDQKFRTKIEITQEQKELLTWNKKHFSIIFKELPFKQIKMFLEGESSTLKESKYIVRKPNILKEK